MEETISTAGYIDVGFSVLKHVQ